MREIWIGDVVTHLASLGSCANQTTATQAGEVIARIGAREAEGVGKIAGVGRAIEKRYEDVATSGVSKRTTEAMQGVVPLGKLQHRLNNTAATETCKVRSPCSPLLAPRGRDPWPERDRGVFLDEEGGFRRTFHGWLGHVSPVCRIVIPTRSSTATEEQPVSTWTSGRRFHTTCLVLLKGRRVVIPIGDWPVSP